MLTSDDFTPSFHNAEWYVIHTYPGYERKVQQNLLERIKDEKLEDKIFQVVALAGRQSCILVEMVWEEAAWKLVPSTSGITGFLGTKSRPFPHVVKIQPKET
ncbi:MAG TPA: transcription termination/antitermination NusG family protein [Anaerolineae bacterium]